MSPIRAREAALRRFHEEDELERGRDLGYLGRLWPYIRPDGRLLAGSAVLLVVEALLGLARPLVMRHALDRLAEPGGLGVLHRTGWLLALLIVAEQLVSFPQTYWLQIAGARGMARLRRRVLEFLHDCPIGFFDRTPIGRLVTRVTNDVDAIGEMFASGALNAPGDLLRLGAIAAIMLVVDWRLALVAFAVLPPVALGVEWARRRIRDAWRIVRVKTARLHSFLNEQVSGIALVQAFAHERASEREFARINGDYRAASMRAIVLDAGLDAAMEAIASICIAAMIWYAGLRELGAELTFGTLFAFVVYVEMFFVPVRNLSARYSLVQSALAGAERVFQLLDREERDELCPPPFRGPEPARASERRAGDEREAVRPADAIALESVTFGYRPGEPVLREVSLRVPMGQTIALVGPSGSGKSTIASLVLRLYTAAEGTVSVRGRDVRLYRRAELRRLFAVVPQDVYLFPASIASNVAAGDGRVDRERVRRTLDRLGALEIFERRAGGIDASVAERGAALSAGERQLVAFARALYRDPPILVLDEPTASIDSDTEQRVQQALEALTRGRSVLVIAHRLSTVRRADSLVVLHHGHVVEQGTYEELLASGGLFTRLHRLELTRAALAARASR